ncbi:MAG: acetyltransferase [Pseudomonadales bacterium]|nr:acetyltransferase [Pseudomonadales bacterium]
MDLTAYLERIEFSGTPAVDLATLKTVHHQHLLHIPYENIDVQLGSPLDFDMQRIFNKLVTANRGGWCYEMNGLLGWALQEIGFEVTRMCGGVMREFAGDEQIGNHLILEVNLNGDRWLADVGLGDGIRQPIPIAKGSHTQQGLSYKLATMPDGFWRFSNHQHSNVKSFDFMHQPANEEQLAQRCQWLQTDPQSPFMMALIIQRFTPETIEVQLGKMHTTIRAEGKQTTEINSLEAMQEHLQTTFGLSVDISPAWDGILAAHKKFTEERTG